MTSMQKNKQKKTSKRMKKTIILADMCLAQTHNYISLNTHTDSLAKFKLVDHGCVDNFGVQDALEKKENLDVLNTLEVSNAWGIKWCVEYRVLNKQCLCRAAS